MSLVRKTERCTGVHVEWTGFRRMVRWYREGEPLVGTRQLLTTRLYWFGPVTVRIPWERSGP